MILVGKGECVFLHSPLYFLKNNSQRFLNWFCQRVERLTSFFHLTCETHVFGWQHKSVFLNFHDRKKEWLLPSFEPKFSDLKLTTLYFPPKVHVIF